MFQHPREMSKNPRRKGNAKAASSAQAADLLATTGQSSFIGFDGGFTNVFAAAEDEMPTEMDSDVVIVLKKLAKKDPQTREKGLRELLDILSKKEGTVVEMSYSHYATIYDKLALDGSPTVRMLSTKLAEFFVHNLKKTAGKHLKLIMPFVILAGNDSSNTVCNQAMAFLNTFSDGKRNKVLDLYAATTASIAVELISGHHPLFQPQKYDDDETTDQREARLTTQCLQTLARISEDVCKVDESILPTFFADSASIKKLLKMPAVIQASVLGLAMKLPNCVPIIIGSPLLNQVMSNLDSSDHVMGSSAFNAFVVLAKHEKFYDEVNIKKTVIPKLLNVVRKKLSHWGHVGPFLLPAMSLVIDRSEEVDKQQFVANFLVSFMDNLPFDTANDSLWSNWAASFCECVKYALSRFPLNETRSRCSDLILNALEFAISEASVLTPMVELLHWIAERNILDDQMQSFINGLQLNMINKLPDSGNLLSKLLEPCLWSLRLLHLGVLRVDSSKYEFLSPLASCSDQYHDWIHKELDILSIILGNTVDFSLEQSKTMADVVVRALQRNIGHIEIHKTYRMMSPDVCPLVYSIYAAAATDGNENAWQAVQSNVRCSYYCTEACVIWMNMSPAQVHSVVNILKKYPEGSRDFANVMIQSASPSKHSLFLLDLVEKVQLSSEILEEVASIFFRGFVDVWSPLGGTPADVKRLLDATSTFLPSSAKLQSFVPEIVGCIETHFSMYLNKSIYPFDDVHAIAIGKSINRILPSKPSHYQHLLCCDEFIEQILDVLDKLIFSQELPAWMALFSTADNPSNSFTVDEKLFHSITHQLSAAVLIYAQLWNAKKMLERTSALFAIQIVTCMLSERVLPFYSSDCLNAPAKHAAIATLANNGVAEAAVRYFVKTGAHRSCEQAALQHLASIYPHRIRQIDYSTITPIGELLNTHIYCAAKLDCGMLRVGSVNRWICRYHCDSEDPIEYLKSISEYINTNGAEWEGELFNAVSDVEGMWKLNVVCLHAAKRMFERFDSKKVNRETIDFVLCGLVMSMDAADGTCHRHGGLPASAAVRAQLTGSLSLFTDICKLVEREKDVLEELEFTKEWLEFFYPALVRLVYRLWSHLKSSDVTSTLCRTICEAVMCIKDVPLFTEFGIRATFSPELDVLNYDPGLQTLILGTIDLLKQGDSVLLFTARRVLTLLAPIMYRHENGDWSDQDEFKVSKYGPHKTLVPFVLFRVINEERGMPSFIGLDAALESLQVMTSDEERGSYCSSFGSVVSKVLPQLIDACPREITPSRQRAEYFTSDVSSWAEHTTEKRTHQRRFICHLLYKTTNLIPAVVRSWYNSLPKNAATTVNRYVSTMCSEFLIEDEMARVKKANKEQLQNEKLLKIRVVPTAREIVAEYTIEETTMRLVITMPVDYPLSVPTIQLDKSVVPSERTKKWLLQMTAYLFHQNGASVDGILMWRRNVDRDVEGAESCCICMMTIHSTTHQLPKVKCRQCKNKFHSNCLYKWFESSNQSSCPLCRTNFT